jgi:hypothetical protein
MEIDAALGLLPGQVLEHDPDDDIQNTENPQTNHKTNTVEVKVAEVKNAAGKGAEGVKNAAGKGVDGVKNAEVKTAERGKSTNPSRTARGFADSVRDKLRNLASKYLLDLAYNSSLSIFR